MKKLNVWRSLLILVGMTTLCSSCEEEWDKWDATSLTTEGAPQENFTYLGGECTMEVKCNTAWSITKTVDWIEVSPTEGRGNTVVTYRIPAYKESKVRKGTIIITAQDADATAGCTTTRIDISQYNMTKSLNLAVQGSECVMLAEKTSDDLFAYKLHVKLTADAAMFRSAQLGAGLNDLIENVPLRIGVIDHNIEEYSSGTQRYEGSTHWEHSLSQAEKQALINNGEVEFDTDFAYKYDLTRAVRQTLDKWTWWDYYILHITAWLGNEVGVSEEISIKKQE